MFYRLGMIGLGLLFVVQVLFGLSYTDYIGRDAAIVLFAATFSIFLLIAPYLLGLLKFDLFAPLTLILVTFLIGTGWRIPYILIYRDDMFWAQFLMHGLEFSDLAPHAPWFVLSVFAMVLGYVLTTKRLAFERAPFWAGYQFDRGRLRLFALVFGAIGTGFGLLFLSAGGINLTGDLLGSVQKIHLGAREDVSLVAGMSRFFADWAAYPFIALAGMVMAGIAGRGADERLMLALLAIPVLAVPFFSSARAALVMNVTAVLIIAYYYKRLNPVKLLIFALLAVLLISYMGQVRAANRGVDIDRGGAVGAIIGSGNGVDMVRALGIMHHVPERYPYQWGTTYTTVVFFAVPRAVWPNKPEVGLGPLVKTEILRGGDVSKNGWPSSMIGEAYLNFGKVGLIVILFLYGALQRLFYNSFRPFLGQNFAITLLYAMIVWRFSLSTTMLNFAHGIAMMLLILIPFCIFMALCRAYPKTSTARVGLAAPAE